MKLRRCGRWSEEGEGGGERGSSTSARECSIKYEYTRNWRCVNVWLIYSYGGPLNNWLAQVDTEAGASASQSGLCAGG